MALIGEPYPSQEAAHRAARAVRDGLLLWAVESRVGLDVGNERPTGGVSPYGQGLIEAATGRPFRLDVHGIDVYLTGDVQFRSFYATATLQTPPDRLVSGLAAALQHPPNLSEQQSLAAELICLSSFDQSARSQFVTLMTAVEAMLVCADRPPEALAVVADLKNRVKLAVLDEQTRQSMTSALAWLSKQSIGEAGRTLAAKLLPGRSFDGKAAPQFFKSIYKIRSQIVHSGRPSDASVDMDRLASATSEFARALLRESVRQADAA